ncbi:hypothetical protein OC846_002096 [Tilletia horrida]|uniref:Enoyl-CoA hydratase n=1 Tax=Tilletia horrida TaxID=155126 RepID=A0AAN6GRQ6_9BASI|nr:hypothetical protein OC846_002096 [Tilletia horrida]KAK0568118.1 hypothetical protein OC861_002283 [Tilletia horrida]
MAYALCNLPRSSVGRPCVRAVTRCGYWQTRQLTSSPRTAFKDDRQQATDPKSSPFDSSRLAYLSRSKVQDGTEGVLTLTLNRPTAANAISTTLLSQLQDALAYLRFPGISSNDNSGAQKTLDTNSPSPVRTLIIRSAAPKIFCAGADLKERATMTIPQVDAFLSSLRSAFSAVERLPCPVIAALDGLAMGGGLELALCADIRVAGPSATRLGLTEAKLGIIPGAGGTQRMSRLLGPSKAKDLIFSGRLLNAEQAYDIGLVDHLATAENSGASAQGEEAYGKALELAAEMSQNGPLALRAAKLAIDKGSQMDMYVQIGQILFSNTATHASSRLNSETALDFERECYERLFGTEDRLEGLRAFKEKRKPKYIGR